MLEIEQLREKNDLYDEIAEAQTTRLTAGTWFSEGKIELDMTVLDQVRTGKEGKTIDVLMRFVRAVKDYYDTRQKVLAIAEQHLLKVSSKYKELLPMYKSNLIGFLNSEWCGVHLSYQLKPILKFYKEDEKGTLPSSHQERKNLWAQWKGKGEITLDSFLLKVKKYDKEFIRQSYESIKKLIAKKDNLTMDEARDDDANEEQAQEEQLTTEEETMMRLALDLLTPVMIRMTSIKEGIVKKSTR